LRNADDELSMAAARLVADIQASIRARFPSASFNVRIGPDGRVYLAAYTDATQDFEVQDLVAERTVDALIAGEVKVHVFPRRPPPPSPPTTAPSPRQ
jgi:hypothetical protein